MKLFCLIYNRFISLDDKGVATLNVEIPRELIFFLFSRNNSGIISNYIKLRLFFKFWLDDILFCKYIQVIGSSSKHYLFDKVKKMCYSNQSIEKFLLEYYKIFILFT